MKKNKSPGLDGISIEFYKKFWPLIGNLLVKVFNNSYENGILTESQRVSVFTLIFKKGDDSDLSNYRPISLTNVDYRIMAFVLAARLQCVLDSLISHDQTAYIKNRYMGYNIRLIEDVIEHFDKLQMNGVMFFADFQKAFDSLDWNFMFSTLDFLTLGHLSNTGLELCMHHQLVKLKIMAICRMNSQYQEAFDKDARCLL